jgi:hypothetical protein
MELIDWSEEATPGTVPGGAANRALLQPDLFSWTEQPA